MSDKKSNERLLCLIMLIIYTATMLASLIVKIIFKTQYRVPCLLILVGGILFVLVGLRIKCDEEELKNRAILIYSGVTKLIFVFGASFENKLFLEEALTAPDDPMMYVAYILAPIFAGVELYMFVKDKKGIVLRKYIMISFLFIYVLGVLNIMTFWVLLMIIPILTSYTQFEDVKLITKGGILANFIAVGGAFSQLYFHYKPVLKTNMFTSIPNGIKYVFMQSHTKEEAYRIWGYVVMLVFILLYTLVMIRATFLVKKFNERKLDLIKKERNKIDEITDKVIEIGMKIKTSIKNTNDLFMELDESVESSGCLLNDILNGNEENLERVQRQNEMTYSISNAIYEMVNEAKKVSEATKKSLESLDKGKKSFVDLRNKSNEIYGNNKKVISVMEEFVENAREVRNITSGIANISDETNLLSLNASIKSARAGELGKGFAVVSNEIRTLADETSILTESIDEIVNLIENNAYVAQGMVNEVVGAINDENETIDKTMSDFINMELHINGLSNNVADISDSVKKVSNFNHEIENHSVQLKDSSESVAMKTKEAQVINEENKDKIKETRKLMDKLMITSNKIDEIRDLREIES